MKNIPSYGKILTLGATYTENALVGEVIIQEKIDGSQFRWGVDEDRNIVIASRNRPIISEAPPQMFALGVEHILRIKKKLEKLPPNTFFYGEYLSKPKHNTLKYERVPMNHIVLFDVISGAEYLDGDALAEIAFDLEVDIVPEFYRGETEVDKLKKFHKKESYLGGTKVEGIVIKNYTQKLILGGGVYPLFTKYVRDEYRELHQKNPMHKTPKIAIDMWCKGFQNENRWKKCFQYCRDAGDLVDELKDIGTITKRIMVDIDEEETENIKNFLYGRYIKTIKTYATRGFAEWYKDLLLERLKEKEHFG